MSDKYCKYGKMQRWVSYDSGITWSPMNEYQKGELIERDSVDCGWEPTPPTPSYETQYLTLRAREAGTFSFSNAMSYSLDSGMTWTTLEGGASTPTIQSGETVMWKGNSRPYQFGGIGTFSSTGEFDVEGNPMSMLYGDNFEGVTDLTGKDYAFNTLFKGCTKLISVENLVLPATTLVQSAYYRMFSGCTSLMNVPNDLLPATTLAYMCYEDMFAGCTSLTTAPELPATTLADHCYQWMFHGCTSLTTAPILSATTLANRCYGCMFRDCTSLTTAPELPATTLAPYCYQLMFDNCTSLTTAPTLSATSLVEGSYEAMFSYCTSLSAITCLATDISASRCTNHWLEYVSSTGIFTKDASMNDWTRGDSGIPNGWTVNTPPTPPTPEDYLTFVALADGTFSFSGSSGGTTVNQIQYSLDSGATWSSLSRNVTTPTLHSGDTVIWRGNMIPTYQGSGIGTFSSTGAFDIKGNPMCLLYGDNFIGVVTIEYCTFERLFSGCTNLISAENLNLPATTLEYWCYADMFSNCTSLTTAPVLPAPVFCTCYYEMMFYGCTSLNNVTCLATYYGNDDEYCGDCIGRWLENVSPTGTFTKAAGMNDWPSGDSGIPNGWTIQDYQP